MIGQKTSDTLTDTDVVIPDRIFFRIGEVSDIVGVKSYVLRYWESEFSLTLHKSPTGQRLYRRKDIERILLIKRLLHSEGFTIAGARQYLNRYSFSDEELNRLSPRDRSTYLEPVPSDVSVTVEDPVEQKMSIAGKHDVEPEVPNLVFSAGPPPVDPRSIIDSRWWADARGHMQDIRSLIQKARDFRVG